MKKVEQVYREILFQALEKRENTFSQRALSKRLRLSLSTVHLALKPLRRMHAVTVRPRQCALMNAKKALLYWASIRNLQKDILKEGRVEKDPRGIERGMPDTAVFTSYSGFKFAFNEVPADYSEVYVYAKPEDIEKRFTFSKGPSNLFVLQPDENLHRYGKHASQASIFVDLWNAPEWYAKDFLKACEEKMHGLLE